MTVAELEARKLVPVDEFECVRCWRFEQLLRAGYEEEDATELAFHLDIDLHDAVALARRGCPSEIAARILL